MMESIEKLREWASSGKLYDDTKRFALHFADEIEREIAERYIELPCDADGVPIHVGDELFNKNKPTDVYKVTAIADNGYIRIYHDTAHIHSSQCRHVKPRTIEDVLREFAEKCAEGSLVCEEADVRKYADEIRELMEVDG